MTRYDYSAFNKQQNSIDVHAPSAPRQTIIYGAVGVLWLALFTYFATSSALGEVGLWLAVGLFCISAPVVAIIIIMLSSRQDAAMLKFAKLNKLKVAHGARPKDLEGMEGSVFFSGQQRMFALLFQEMGKLAADIGTYQYISIKRVIPAITYTVGVVRCRLPSSVWSRYEAIALQNNVFDKHLRRYISASDLKEILDPSVEEALNRARGEYTIEIASGYLFLYAQHALTPVDAERFEGALDKIEELYSILVNESVL